MSPILVEPTPSCRSQRRLQNQWTPLCTGMHCRFFLEHLQNVDPGQLGESDKVPHYLQCIQDNLDKVGNPIVCLRTCGNATKFSILVKIMSKPLFIWHCIWKIAGQGVCQGTARSCTFWTRRKFQKNPSNWTSQRSSVLTWLQFGQIWKLSTVWWIFSFRLRTLSLVKRMQRILSLKKLFLLPMYVSMLIQVYGKARGSHSNPAQTCLTRFLWPRVNWEQAKSWMYSAPALGLHPASCQCGAEYSKQHQFHTKIYCHLVWVLYNHCMQ